MVLGVGLFVVAATLTSLVITAFNSFLHFEIAEAGITVASQIGLTTVGLVLLSRVLPDAEVTWRDVWIGAVVTAVLISLGINVLGLCLSVSNVGSAMGAAGALAVFLLTFYFVGQIFVFGAVFTRVYATRLGSMIVPRDESHLMGEIPVDDAV